MSSSLQKDEQQQVVLCDMCIEEERKPAKKTCVKCEISMCVQHLQAHLTTPVLLQTHPLTEPVAPGEAGLGGTTKCPQHGKILEYYCLDDLISVCVSCAIEDQHRLHNMKTLSTAHTELLKKLEADQQVLANKGDSLEGWEKTERETLSHSSVRLIEAVSTLRDISLASIQRSVSARMVAIITGKNSIQAAQNEKDTYRFLQMYAQVNEDVEKAKVVDVRPGLEPGNDRDKLVQRLMKGGDKMETQSGQLWCSLLTLVDPENHKQLIINSGLAFDPATLTTGMFLSKNHRKVYYSSQLGQLSPRTIEIKKVAKPLSKWHRWTVRLSKQYDWTIGFCDTEAAINLTVGEVYGLQCKGTQLSSLTTEYDYGEEYQPSAKKVCGTQQTTEKPKCNITSQVIEFPGETEAEKMSRPEWVEVFWNPLMSLTFFSRSSPCKRREILKVDMSNKSYDLFPFVNLNGDMAQKNQSQQQSQQQWKCQCDVVYQKNGNTWYISSQGMCSSRGNSSSHDSICSCGRLIGEPRIAEVLCQLL